MAGERTAAWPSALLHGVLAKIAALPTRNIRVTVLLCVIAIGGSFAAAGALQMRFDRVQALRQAAYFETRRAHEIAAVAEATFNRYARLGQLFAADRMTDAAFAGSTGLRGIAVADSSGRTQRAVGETIDMASLAELARKGRVVLGTSQRIVIAFAEGGSVVAVSFDAAALAPAALLDGANLATATGQPIGGLPQRNDTANAAVRGWPVEARVPLDDEGALAAWYGSLPLYLFVILGPALVGGALAAVFVREFERRDKAATAIRTLRSTRPEEAKLLVRLANAERGAVEAQRSKGEFVAHMSHELRTPLNAIIGFAEVIERGFYGPVGHHKYIEYARDIGMAGRSLHGKIGDILEFANLEAGRYPLKPARFDVTEVVGACVNENVGRAFSRRIALEMVPAEPAEVLADAMAVRRIVTNLLSNALLYTHEGGRVHVSVRQDEGAVAISVRDNGNGFTPAEADKAGVPFRRFERAGISMGAGLGLAIVVALARRMGGAVKLASAHGEGTCAELRLPKA
ncbi:MAG: HAMP domain-containing histidine kinase [Alphaproteobacteria bacterium]|nr:HAMP domain-containing histidine kinase [Alphaproteobacteria bacterium]MDE2112428.1 HAMP domain-containing histidine kinase [Alphaproteobacteria bacterium]MDE2494069.1 HAMP domain-containing histidine kinase [Alphaproteobacteria bacterium]